MNLRLCFQIGERYTYYIFCFHTKISIFANLFLFFCFLFSVFKKDKVSLQVLFLKHQRRSFIDYKKKTKTFRCLWRTCSHCFLLFHYFRWYFDQLVEFIIKSVKSIHLSVFENVVVVVPSKPNICFQFHCKATWKNVCVCAVCLPNTEILT